MDGKENNAEHARHAFDNLVLVERLWRELSKIDVRFEGNKKLIRSDTTK